MKTTTFAVLLANIVATYRQQDSAHFFDVLIFYNFLYYALFQLNLPLLTILYAWFHVPCPYL
jgi:hypothetical protein